MCLTFMEQAQWVAAKTSLDPVQDMSIAGMDAVLGGKCQHLVACVAAIDWNTTCQHKGPVKWHQAQLIGEVAFLHGKDMVAVKAKAVAGAAFAAKALSFQSSVSCAKAAQPVLASSGEAVARSTGAHILVLLARPWNMQSASTMPQQGAAQAKAGPP
jgi:hypothetical protein